MSRKPNFEPIAHLIPGEFSLLVAIAFDEITSARAYAHDRNTFFQLGGTPFLTWVKYAGRDEAVHARNALKLLEHRHSHRRNDIAAQVEAICNYDLVGQIEYHGTFLFDHDTDDFSKSLLAESGRTLCSYFNQGTAFEKFSAQFRL